MPSEVVAVLGALAGVLIGGLVNYFTHRSVKNHEWRLALARDDAARRQKLYSEFLVEAQKLVAQAREEKLTSLCDLNPIYGKLAEIRLVAGQTARSCASSSGRPLPASCDEQLRAVEQVASRWRGRGSARSNLASQGALQPRRTIELGL